MFETSSSVPGWDLAIATGCWENSARLKLKTAGLDVQGIPLASSDDHHERELIIQSSIGKAKQHYNQNDYESITYVGDRLWDYRATQKLGIQFIGVGPELKNLAPDVLVIDDYYDQQFIERLKLGIH